MGFDRHACSHSQFAGFVRTAGVRQLSREGVVPNAECGRCELFPAVRGYIPYLKDRSPDASVICIDIEDAVHTALGELATQIHHDLGNESEPSATVRQQPSEAVAVTAAKAEGRRLGRPGAAA